MHLRTAVETVVLQQLCKNERDCGYGIYCANCISFYIGSYMNVHILLNSLDELRKIDKM